MNDKKVVSGKRFWRDKKWLARDERNSKGELRWLREDGTGP